MGKEGRDTRSKNKSKIKQAIKAKKPKKKQEITTNLSNVPLHAVAHHPALPQRAPVALADGVLVLVVDGGVRGAVVHARLAADDHVALEAAQHGVPTVGYHHAAGLRDSIDDGETGLLTHDVAAMTAATDRLLADRARRDRMGEAARRKASAMSWPATASAMAQVLDAVAAGRRVSGVISGRIDAGASGGSGRGAAD